MQKSESQDCYISESITDYIYTVRVEAGTPVETAHSETCLSVTGYSREELIDNPYLWILMVHEEDHHLVKQQATQALSIHSPPSVTHRIFRKDGTLRWVESTVIPNHDTDGNLISYCGIVRDITEQKKMEEHLTTIDKLISEADQLMHKNNGKKRTEQEASTALSSNNPKKRMHNRVSTGDKCWAEISDSGKISLKDISIGGTCLKSSQHLPVNSWHQIKIMSDGKEEIHSTGVVIWSQSSGNNNGNMPHYETGLKFVELNGRLKNSLGRFIVNLSHAGI